MLVAYQCSPLHQFAMCLAYNAVNLFFYFHLHYVYQKGDSKATMLYTPYVAVMGRNQTLASYVFIVLEAL